MVRKFSARKTIAFLICFSNILSDAATIAQVSAPEKKPGASPRKPFSFNECGGGFTTMTQGMAMGRALSSIGALDKVTHVGSNSGGYWFSSQFFYSKRFYEEVTDPSRDLSAFVTAWGLTYEAAMNAAVDSGMAWATSFDAGTFSKLHPLCQHLAEEIEKLLGPLDSRDFPAQDWLPYIAAMLKAWIPDIETLVYNSRSFTGLQNATLIQQVTVPPDAFLDDSTIATRSIEYAAGYSPNTTSSAYILPIAHVHPPAAADGSITKSSWLYSDNVINITAKTGGLRKTEINLLEKHNTLLIEVTGASSAAAGLLASPAMAEEYAPGIASNPVDSCWPLGLESLATPMLVEGYTLPTGQDAINGTVSAEDMTYRLLDGGYIDNTNAAFTLARMQAECATASEGCDTYTMIIAGDAVQNSLFFNPEYPPGSFIGPSLKGFNGPIPTIFSREPPSADELIPYATIPMYNSTQLSTSYYWTGELTTVANEWFGVQGGAKVKLLYFAGDWDPIIVPGTRAALLFSEVYAPSVVAQAEGAAPIIEAFLGDI